MLFPCNGGRLSWICFSLLVGTLLGTPCFAQIKYDPDMEVIEKMARRGVAYLEESAGTQLAGEQLALVALTISEVSKRYDRLIPSDHPLVFRSIDSIKAYIDNEGVGRGMANHGNIYYPALALIVLCDVDDQKYEPYIIKLLNMLEGWQQSNGSYNYPFKTAQDDSVGDISQTQYACLAFFVAKHHGYRVDPEVAKKTLEWLVNSQVQSSWYYHSRDGRPVGAGNRDKEFTLSRHCSGLGSTYLMSNLLQLTPRSRKKNGKKIAGSGGLPPSVSMYVKPKVEVTEEEKKVGPLVSFDGGKLANCKRQGNIWFADNFKIETKTWNYYYLYALERYAFFREVAEGEVSEVPTWYDQGVEFLMERQGDAGDFPPGGAVENSIISTSLAVLFLVRSSEVLILPTNTSLLHGGQGFLVNTKLTVKGGQISSQAAIQGIEDVIVLLGQDSAAEQLQVLAEAMDETIRQFTIDEKSRGETMAFMTGLVKDRNYFRRLIAVKILAREQSMDHVPALLYALGDPDVRVAKEAHDGLRLISRKIDAFSLPENPSLEDFGVVKKQWTKWYLEIRPGAELID